MFTVSDSAAAAIRTIVTNARAPEDSGLRIAPDGDSGALQLMLAPHPEQGDTVYRAGEAQVFLDQKADTMLDGQVIEAAPSADGSMQFVVVPADA